MRKTNLKESTGSDQSFRNALECSSIRINIEESIDFRNTNRSANNKPPPRRFEENSLAGFEQSLSMQGCQGNLLELMRSKSANHFVSKEQKQPQLKVEKKVPQHMNSLYNTSSFDDMTMKISVNNKTNQNMSNLHNLTSVSESPEFRKLKKPQEMQQYKCSYPDSEIKIMINQIHREQQNPEIVIKEQDQTEEQRRLRQLKVEKFIKSQAMLDDLKVSNAQSEPSQNIQESSSFHQPYFKSIKTQSQQNIDIKDRTKDSDKKQQFANKHNLRLNMPLPAKTPKKLTLRDYIQLNQLSSKITEQDLNSTPNSPLSPLSPLSPKSQRKGLTGSRRKKPQASKSDVLLWIKNDILKDLQLMQNNIQILTTFFSSQEVQYQPQNLQIMRLYTINRMIKQKMLMGNDEIVKYMKGPHDTT